MILHPFSSVINAPVMNTPVQRTICRINSTWTSGIRIHFFRQRNSGDAGRSFPAGESRGCGSIIFCRETLEMRVDYFLQRNPGNAEQSYPINGTVSDLSIVFMAISCLFGFGLPIVLLLYFRKKFKADFMAFVVGGAVMFLFALVLEATVHQIILATPAGKAVLSSAILYAVYGGFMAALFEETGRFLAMKTILRPYQKKDVNALMYGAGHGGIEAAAILGIGMINNLIWSVMINTGN